MHKLTPAQHKAIVETGLWGHVTAHTRTLNNLVGLGLVFRSDAARGVATHKLTAEGHRYRLANIPAGDLADESAEIVVTLELFEGNRKAAEWHPSGDNRAVIWAWENNVRAHLSALEYAQERAEFHKLNAAEPLWFAYYESGFSLAHGKVHDGEALWSALVARESELTERERDAFHSADDNAAQAADERGYALHTAEYWRIWSLTYEFMFEANAAEYEDEAAEGEADAGPLSDVEHRANAARAAELTAEIRTASHALNRAPLSLGERAAHEAKVSLAKRALAMLPEGWQPYVTEPVKGLRIGLNGSVTVFEATAAEETVNEAKRQIGGAPFLTRVTGELDGRPVALYVDEDGQVTGREVNVRATQFAHRLLGLPSREPLLGPVVVYGLNRRSKEDADVPAEVIAYLSV